MLGQVAMVGGYTVLLGGCGGCFFAVIFISSVHVDLGLGLVLYDQLKAARQVAMVGGYAVLLAVYGASGPGADPASFRWVWRLMDVSCAVRATPGRSSALRVFLCKSGFYGAFVRARRALTHQKRRFPARAGDLRRRLVAARRLHGGWQAGRAAGRAAAGPRRERERECGGRGRGAGTPPPPPPPARAK
jgi:hypothetical protein